MCHIILDLKMEFSRKSRIVANEAMTKTPSSLTYSSFISRESVCLGLLIAELNDLYIMTCDVKDAYLNAPWQENIWFKAGPYHGPERTGKVMIMIGALYGLNSIRAAWKMMFAVTLYNMDFFRWWLIQTFIVHGK